MVLSSLYVFVTQEDKTQMDGFSSSSIKASSLGQILKSLVYIFTR